MTDSTIPARILEIETQWRAWLEVFASTLNVKQDALPVKMRDVFRTYPDDIVRHVLSLLAHTVTVAGECLSITGALTVSSKPYAQRFVCDDDGYSVPNHIGSDVLAWARSFSPVEVFRAVAEDYPAKDVRELESATLAQHVFNRFDLAGNSPVVQRAGKVVLSLSADSNTSSGGTFSYSHHWAEGLHNDVRSVGRILLGLLAFDGELDDLRMPLSSALLAGGHVSRERIALTDDIGLILYKNKVEVLLTPKAGAALNSFLGEWIAPANRAA